MSETDKTLKNNNGDTIVPPTELSIVEFAKSRACEMEAMAHAVKSNNSNRTTNQLLPRHMRRRAASHNIKRLPKRLRDAARRERQKGKNEPVVTKRPSRKHRRRPKNLLSDYSRRAKEHAWLETHIWHAKRFKMVDLWGCRIPLHPNDKSIRASYRACSQHCMLQDHSYFNCIEMSGKQDILLQGFRRITHPETGETFASRSSLSGSREGKAMLYKCEAYPCFPIGPARFLWEQQSLDESCGDNAMENCDRKIWIWIHPAVFYETVSEIRQAFGDMCEMEKLPHADDPTSNNTTQTSTKESKSLTFKEKIEAGKLLLGRSFSNRQFKMTSFKDELSRFCLTGPESFSVLHDALQIAEIINKIDKENTPKSEKDPASWWIKWCLTEENVNRHHEQRKLWESVKACNPAHFPPHCVLGLTVKDPRLFVPKKKEIIKNEDIIIEAPLALKQWPKGVSTCQLWHADIRKAVKETKMSEQELNQRKSKNVIQGTPLTLGLEESSIPVLLIQNPGTRMSGSNIACGKGSVCERPGYGSGWDLVIPAGWSMAFWIALVYRGARVGGIREFRNLAREQELFHFPDDFPDTEAGREMENSIKQELESKCNKMPKAKKPNFVKLGVQTPFHCPWQELIQNWLESKSSAASIVSRQRDMEVECQIPKSLDAKFFVLRSLSKLREINQLCSRSYIRKGNNVEKNETHETHERPAKIAKTMEAETSLLDVSNCRGASDSKFVVFESLTSSFCLLPVLISMVSRGVPKEFSHICLPHTSDLIELQNNQKYGGPTENDIKMRNNKRENENCDSGKTVELNILKQSGSLLNVKDNCNRTVFGFVKKGNVSLSLGKGSGLGFVSPEGLRTLLKDKESHRHAMVLVRCPTTFQYRFAYISIVV